MDREMVPVSKSCQASPPLALFEPLLAQSPQSELPGFPRDFPYGV